MMKVLITVVGASVMLSTVPSFACGPTAPSSSGPTTTNSQQIDPVKRQRWVVKRMRHLQRQHEIDKAIFVVDSEHRPSDQRVREYATNRFEYLLLKSQHQELTMPESAEFFRITNYLRSKGVLK
jgi:hypothetical protein